jgi:hypothetical protein
MRSRWFQSSINPVLEIGGACSTYERLEMCIEGFWNGELRERDNLEDSVADGIVITIDLQAVEWGTRTGLIRIRTGRGVFFCECGLEPSGSVTCREFID